MWSNFNQKNWGISVRVKLDTGAEVNVMPKRDYDQLKKCNKKITKISVKMYGYGGHDIPVVGTIRLECSVNDVRKSTDFYPNWFEKNKFKIFLAII